MKVGLNVSNIIIFDILRNMNYLILTLYNRAFKKIFFMSPIGDHPYHKYQYLINLPYLCIHIENHL